ncbi:phospholipase D family protein [Pseudomonas sp.]|uniref:phospholipase D family protein n=1 Tax=Pseudomonas sp. TaxID=306 RepID=UPI003A976805
MTSISPVTGSKETCQRLIELIEQCRSFSWLSAWCTSNPAYDAALAAKDKLGQLVIGTTRYFTDAACLDEFENFPPARVFAPNAAPMFHPKVYGFDLGDELCVYVGSANLTGAGMARNIEAGVFLQGDRKDPALRSFFDLIHKQWIRAESIDSDFIKSYRANQKRVSDALQELERFTRIKKPVVRRRSTKNTDLNDMDWALYVRSVRSDKANDLQGRLKVLSFARQLFASDTSFTDLPDIDRRRIGGLLRQSSTEELDWGLFGQMTSAGRLFPALDSDSEAISRALDQIPVVGAVKRRHYDAFVENFLQVQGAVDTWIGFGTRLLAMKRPDYFFCYCDPNKRGLADAFGVAFSTVNLHNYWDRFIEPMQLMPWWQQELPESADEQSLWMGRAALLDAIYYDPAMRRRVAAARAAHRRG